MSTHLTEINNFYRVDKTKFTSTHMVSSRIFPEFYENTTSLLLIMSSKIILVLGTFSDDSIDSTLGLIKLGLNKNIINKSIRIY